MIRSGVLQFRKGWCFAILLMLLVGILNAQTLQEKLGYSANTKLLIIHADDFGLCHSENRATIKALETGIVNSASIMVPCPWFTEAANYFRENPQFDIGVHLTVTNEWGQYKWGPVVGKSGAPSLVDAEGFMHESCEGTARHADIKELEKELRAQIDKLVQAGVKPTHLDSHMGCMFWTREDILELYIQLGKDYQIPVMLNKDFFAYGFLGEEKSKSFMKYLDDEDLVIAQRVMMDMGAKNKEELFSFYDNALNSLVPGLNVMVIHVGYNNEELRGITSKAKFRNWDLNYFTNPTTRENLQKQGVVMVTWREVNQAFMN